MNSITWQKLEIDCAAPVSETIASHFSDLTGSGVEVRDRDTEKTDSAIVIAYLDSDSPSLADTLAAARNYLQEIANLFPEYPPPTLRQNSVADEDWGRKWKENFKPFKLTDTLVVKPTWESYTPSENEKVIEIDPGMAFGTGLHASTRLASILIEEYVEKNPHLPKSILDIGTGTGILAICCASLGCNHILAIDNDSEAVKAARENILVNNMTGSIEAGITGLDDLSGPFDLVIANIIHNTLVEMAPSISRLMPSGGTLIMAGILAGEQAKNISRVYEGFGVRTISEKVSGEWTALLLKKQ